MDSQSSFLTTVPYQLFDKWYVEFYINQKKYSSHYNMLLLKELIFPIRRVIKKDAYDGTLPVVSKIVFKTGEIIFRDENKTGMDLLRVCKGDLLVSSINFHQGAITLSNFRDFVCSTHYQTFLIDTTKIIPEYLVLILRTQQFIEMVAGIKANGIKNESGYDFIGSFKIPVPPLTEQQKILDNYYGRINQSYLLNEKADMEFSRQLADAQRSISSYKKEILTNKQTESLLNIISFASIDRWEVGYIYKDGVIDALVKSFQYPAMTIGELQKESLFGLSVKASLEKKDGMIPVLRMPNIKNGEVCCEALKYLPYDCASTSKEPDKWLLKKGDFLIARSNSKELVGKAAVFELDEVYTYASYLIRYRFDTNLVLPEYVNIVFMTSIVREQIDVLMRQGCEQYNLNSDEINSIRIPVPNIETQEKIIQVYKKSLDRMKRLRKQAADSLTEANHYIATKLFC